MKQKDLILSNSEMELIAGGQDRLREAELMVEVLEIQLKEAKGFLEGEERAARELAKDPFDRFLENLKWKGISLLKVNGINMKKQK